MSEEWRQVPGLEGFYEASSLGSVRGVKRKGSHGKPLRATTNKGHLQVSISVAQKVRSVAVHQLVALAFVGPRPSLDHEVRHIDGNGLRNVPENLCWDTRAKNVADQVLHGDHYEARRTECDNGHAFTEENVYRAPGRPSVRVCRACRRERARRARLAA